MSRQTALTETVRAMKANSGADMAELTAQYGPEGAVAMQHILTMPVKVGRGRPVRCWSKGGRVPARAPAVAGPRGWIREDPRCACYAATRGSVLLARWGGWGGECKDGAGAATWERPGVAAPPGCMSQESKPRLRTTRADLEAVRALDDFEHGEEAEEEEPGEAVPLSPGGS